MASNPRIGRVIVALAFIPTLLLFAAPARAGDVTSLRFISGRIDGSCGIVVGSGFSCAHPSTGLYQMTFTTAFSVTPVCTANAANTTAMESRIVHVDAVSTTGAAFRSRHTASDTATDVPLSFICTEGGDNTIVAGEGGTGGVEGEVSLVSFEEEVQEFADNVLFGMSIIGAIAVALLAGILVTVGLRR